MIERRPEGAAVADGAPVEAAALAGFSWTDPAAQWGLGVFETIAVREHRARFVLEHLARLSGAAEALAIPLPPAEALEAAIERVASGHVSGHGWLKIAVSRSGHWVALGGAEAKEDEGRAVSAVILPWRRHRLDPLSGMKTLAAAGMIRGLEEARRRGADEGLWLNDRGHVVEACTANVFVIRGRAAVTPPVSDGARPGVTRARAIEALRALGLQVREARLRVLALRTADEILLTSSLGGVRPVVRLDGKDVRRGRVGRTTARLAEFLAEKSARRDPAATIPGA